MAQCPAPQIPLGIGDACVPLHSHIACFWDTPSDFASALGFLEQGLQGTDHAVLFGTDKANLQACRILADRGFDPEALQAQGRLALIGPGATGAATLESIARTFTAQLEAGARTIRLFGNIGWLEQGWPKVAELLGMEAEVSAAALEFPCVALCLYQMRNLPALIVGRGALESHSLTVHDGRLVANPYCAEAGLAMRRSDSTPEAVAELEQQREAVQLYRGLFANMQDGLIIVRLDPARPELPSRIVDINSAARNLSGAPAAEFKGEATGTFFPELLGPEFEKACRQSLETGRAVVDLGEARGAGKAFYRVKVCPLFDAFLGVMLEDVTELKMDQSEISQLLSRVRRDAAELERRVAERTAQLQEINEELDTFAYTASHDLRAPLRAIDSFAAILLEHADRADDPQRCEFLKRIVAAAEDMDRLIQDLLAYSRVGRQDILLHTVDLDRVIEEAAEQLRLTNEGVAYHLEIADGLPQVRGDHAVLVQVVLNLLANGVKYVAAGVTPKLRIWAEQADSKVRLFVQDNGIGIAAENQERIFRVLVRLHGPESYPGTGIGLAIARKAVTRLGGRIGVDSRLGEGSRFWIELPGSAREGCRQ